MAPRFFALYDDVAFPRRWHLENPIDGQGREVDDWAFKNGTPVRSEGTLRIPIEHAGRPLDFSETNLGIPIVHLNVAAVFRELASTDVQLLPVNIEGQPDPFFILIAVRLIRCIDETTSKIRLWMPEDGVPHKTGQYKSVRNMRIDKTRVGDAQVFRPAGWEGTLIISEGIKEALERLGATGPQFEEV